MSLILSVTALAVATFTLGLKCGLAMAGQRLREKEAEASAWHAVAEDLRAGKRI